METSEQTTNQVAPEQPVQKDSSLNQDTKNTATSIKEEKQEGPKNELGDEHFDLTDDLLDEAANEVDNKLNLTAGERDEADDELNGEMNDMFDKVMGQFSNNMENPGNPEEFNKNMGDMMGNMTKMLQQMMGEEGGFNMENMQKMMNEMEDEDMGDGTKGTGEGKQAPD